MITMSILNPQEAAESGERIYQKKYKQDYEQKYLGKFVAIEINSENAFIADQPEQALEKARTAVPAGVFHLIKVGASGAFRISYSCDYARSERLFRPQRNTVS